MLKAIMKKFSNVAKEEVNEMVEPQTEQPQAAVINTAEFSALAAQMATQTEAFTAIQSQFAELTAKYEEAQAQLASIEAEKADDEGRISEIKVLDPRKGALTQIFEECRPEGTPVVIETVVEQVDSLVSPVRGTGWQSSHPGDRTVRQELRLILRNSGLPPAGELFDRAYAYIRENY